MREGLERCRSLPGVRDVRVKGAVGVVQLTQPDAARLRSRFVERGVWLRPFGDVVYLMPPLVIDAEDMEVLLRAVHEVVAGAG
jgi:adenosylmethionine-8-amino-7-oxononanoate aminotransferase